MCCSSTKRTPSGQNVNCSRRDIRYTVAENIVQLLLNNNQSLIDNAYGLYNTSIFCCARGRDRMVVGFTTTCAIGAYRH
jgi:hypothetical protein